MRPVNPAEQGSTRSALRAAVNAAVVAMRAARAEGDQERAAEWARFINQTTDIIIAEQRRRRLP